MWSRPLPSVPSSVRVCRDALGHWYVSFVVETEAEPLPPTGNVIGIDWGVKETATTTSEAHDLPHPEFGKKAQQKLSRYQRQTSRRRPARGKPASAGYKRARRKAARAHAKVAAQRQDTARKWAKAVVRDHDEIAVEDFRPKFLAKTTMARKAADAAIGAAKKSLIEMAAKHDRVVHLVDPAHTTMDCSSCGGESQDPPAAVRENLHVRSVRHRPATGQEQRRRHARQGWSQPCRRRSGQTCCGVAAARTVSRESLPIRTERMSKPLDCT